MKTPTLITAILAAVMHVHLVAAPALANEQPSHTIVCMHPPYTNIGQMKLYLPTILASEPAGSSFRFIDSDSLNTVAEITVSHLAVNSIQQQKQKMSPQLARLWSFAESHGPAPSVSNSIDVPRLLRYAATLQPRPTRLVFMDKPTFHLDSSPEFNFDGFRVPADICIESPLAISVFGRQAGFTNQLSGCQVHWFYCSEQTCFPFSFYREAVGSFWAKYLKANFGADLVTFTPDFAQLNRINHSDLAPVFPSIELNRNSAKVEMLVVQPPHPGADRPFADNIPDETKPLARAIGDLYGAGLSWGQQSCDLDIYVFPSPHEAPVYFGNKEDRSHNFLFHQDFQAGTGDAYEWVEVKNPAAVDWSQVEIWANVYTNVRKSELPIRGKYLIALGQNALGQKSYIVGEFELPSSGGNQGHEISNRQQSSFWTRIPIDPSRVFVLSR